MFVSSANIMNESNFVTEHKSCIEERGVVLILSLVVHHK